MACTLERRALMLTGPCHLRQPCSRHKGLWVVHVILPLQNATAAQTAQNEAGRAELASLDADVVDRERRIAELEAAAKQRTDLIERRTREVDALNRNIEKTVAARGPEVHTGTRLWARSVSACLAMTYCADPHNA